MKKANPEREKITKENEMKKDSSDKKTVPVPGRGRMFGGGISLGRKTVIFITAGLLTAAGAAAVGMALTPEDAELPVVLANGEVIAPPCYITVDGEKVALVKSEETAEKALQEAIDAYSGEGKDFLDVEIVEETGIEQMDIKHGDDPPEVLTVEEASEMLTAGDDGESYITVVTTEEQTKKETIDFDEKYKPESDMYVGESRIETEGREGTKAVTRKITSENGEPVDAEIVEEMILEEPVQQIVLTGTRAYDGYGGGDGSYGDENVSRNENGTYDLLMLPVHDFCVTSPFGPRWGSLHTGIDLALAQGKPIYAADSGTVYFSGYGGGYGNLVKIDHGNGMQTYYAHCSRLLVSQGQQVEQGEQIALVGSTGNSTGPHLHFEVIINGNCVDPAGLLPLE